MKRINLKTIFITCLFGIFTILVSAQEKTMNDSVLIAPTVASVTPEPVKKVRKNSIMINITNPALISSKFRMIGYERVLPNNQSFTVNIGQFSIPKFAGDLADSLGLNTNFKDRGFHFSTDYRFYLQKENRHAAPRGVYLAPYYTYNGMKRENSWYLEDGMIDEVYTDITLNIHTIGAELGYQFIFWDRVALDMILIGPGWGFYGVKAEVGSNLDPDKESEFFDKLNEILADKIPGYDKVIDAGEFSKTGTYNVKSVGFRYVIRVGFRF